MVVKLEKRQKTTVIGGQRPPAPFGTSRRPLGTTIHHSGGIGATFEVFHLFGGFLQNLEVIYGRGVVKTLLKGTLAVVSGVVTHTRPPDLKKIQKTWKIPKVAPIPPE